MENPNQPLNNLLPNDARNNLEPPLAPETTPQIQDLIEENLNQLRL